jgi:glucokinase
MAEQLAIGVDIGGTKIAFALVNRKGQVLATHRLPTLPAEGAAAVFDRVAEGVHYLLSQSEESVIGVGIGCPGYINPNTGVVHNATNLAWKDVPLKEGVEKRLNGNLPVWVQKDANAGTLGELYFGAAQGYSDFVYIALGTGLGGGAVSEGKLVQGGEFVAMEIGHMPFTVGGRLCACGMYGCPEMYVSGNGMLAGLKEHLPQHASSILTADSTTIDMLDAARGGDAVGIAIVNETAQWLASVMICLMGILNPSAFVIGGGLGNAAADLLIPRVKELLRKRTRPEVYPEIAVLESQVASSAVGAACQVWYRQ